MIFKALSRTRHLSGGHENNFVDLEKFKSIVLSSQNHFVPDWNYDIPKKYQKTNSKSSREILKIGQKMSPHFLLPRTTIHGKRDRSVHFDILFQMIQINLFLAGSLSMLSIFDIFHPLFTVILVCKYCFHDDGRFRLQGENLLDK